jgi:hypothetical protein
MTQLLIPKIYRAINVFPVYIVFNNCLGQSLLLMYIHIMIIPRSKNPFYSFLLIKILRFSEDRDTEKHFKIHCHFSFPLLSSFSNIGIRNSLPAATSKSAGEEKL